MESVNLYRRRIIPEEYIKLENDHILYQDQSIIVTKWNTLRPKKVLHHGVSCFYLDKGWKVSKFMDQKGKLICWYCDIIEYEYSPETNSYIFTDLLADVLIYPDQSVHVVDLDELADASEQGLITSRQLEKALRQLNELLSVIYKGNFDKLKKPIQKSR